VSVSASDPDGDALTYAVRTPPAHGTVTVKRADLTYTPEAGFAGQDGLMVGTSDGKAATTSPVLITVAPPRPAQLDTSVSADVAGKPCTYQSPVLKRFRK